MYYVEDGCERCGYYECQKCHTRFLSQYIAPVCKCPDCDNEVDMEIGPDDEMAEETTSAKLGSLGVVKNIEFKIVAYLPRFFMLVFVKFYASIYRILLYSVL